MSSKPKTILLIHQSYDHPPPTRNTQVKLQLLWITCHRNQIYLFFPPRYARKIGAGSRSSKELAEGVAFAGSVLPQLAACGDGSAADVLIKYMWIDAIKTVDRKEIWTQVRFLTFNIFGLFNPLKKYV